MRNIRRRVLVVEDGFNAAAAIVRTLNHPRATAPETVRFAAERVSTLHAARKRLELRGFDVVLIGLRPNNGPDIQRIARLRKEFPNTTLVAVADAPEGPAADKSGSGDLLVDALKTLAELQSFFTSKMSALVLQGQPRERARLTPREREIVHLVAEGRSSKEIAHLLGISIKTAETHRSNILRKLGLRSVSQLVRYAIRHKIVEA